MCESRGQIQANTALRDYFEGFRQHYSPRAKREGEREAFTKGPGQRDRRTAPMDKNHCNRKKLGGGVKDITPEGSLNFLGRTLCIT